MSVIEKIFGTHSSRELKRIEPLVDKIEALRPTMQALSDEELRGKTEEYKKRLTEGETLDCFRKRMRPYVRQQAVCLAWSITEYRLSVVLSCIRDVSQRCVPVKVRHWCLHFLLI